MGYRLVPLIVLAFAAGACGKEIGDSCTINTDCDPNGTRICDPPGSSKDGYCTVLGCDYSTCPDEAACIRFFTGSFSNTYKTCNPATEPDQCNSQTEGCCSLDELCAIDGHCVPHASEVRFCMRKCNSDGDCRDGYECRDLDKMIRDGGEPVLSPGLVINTQGKELDPTGKVVGDVPKFCAAAPVMP